MANQNKNPVDLSTLYLPGSTMVNTVQHLIRQVPNEPGLRGLVLFGRKDSPETLVLGYETTGSRLVPESVPAFDGLHAAAQNRRAELPTQVIPAIREPLPYAPSHAAPFREGNVAVRRSGEASQQLANEHVASPRAVGLAQSVLNVLVPPKGARRKVAN